jgi:hypothetical protein
LGAGGVTLGLAAVADVFNSESAIYRFEEIEEIEEIEDIEEIEEISAPVGI